MGKIRGPGWKNGEGMRIDVVTEGLRKSVDGRMLRESGLKKEEMW